MSQSVIWKNDSHSISLVKVNKVDRILEFNKQLSVRDEKQILSAFKSQSYEMMASFIWMKSINSLKDILAKLGNKIIAEILNRTDIDEHTDIRQVLTDYETITLSEELGVITKTGAFRIRQAYEIVRYFSRNDLEDDDENEMTREEAITILKSCIGGILSHQNISAAIDFQNFRNTLLNTILVEDDDYIKRLLNSPYFYFRTVVRILLSMIKSEEGARLSNSLENAYIIIPILWDRLNDPEKWYIGKTYTEIFIEGKTTASRGLKKVLLKVKGFDFVPEDLRSETYILAANEVIQAHEGGYNFYNEPSKIMKLAHLGSSIPIQAFPRCMTAVLSVKLGNFYSISFAAQKYADDIFSNISTERWIYFFNECLSYDERILIKLTEERPRNRWFSLLTSLKMHNPELFNIDKYKGKYIKQLIQASLNSKTPLLIDAIEKLSEKLGKKIV